MQQPVLNDLKLQLTYRTDNLATVELIDKHLGHTLVHQLIEPFVQLLGLHRVGILDIFEHLGRKTGQSLVMKILSCRKCISDLEVSRIGQTYYITGIGLVDRRLALRHKGRRA